ncbi:MAG TPA: ATP-binding cassette domain-containing protein, partial [Anaerolineaceae bacterium]|nr:ATP-binding cassette domain-containing protein [Anaerolineaceae bacterium]
CGSVLYVAPDPFASIHGLTVGQEISFLTADEPAARAALATMGLDPAVLWERETTKLSGGQQVRLVLAGALASQARVLLLDSPMQELDAEGRAAFLEALQILRSRRRCTIVLADYFYRELVPSVDRVVVLEDGAVTAELDPDAFFADAAWLARCHLAGEVPTLPPVEVGEVVAELVDVQVSLEDNWILKGVSFTVRAGEFVAVMGPNGSGKTTAMLTLAGAIAPQRGRVVTAGRVAYVFQHAALQMIALSAADELRFGPRVLGWDAAAAQQFVAEGLAWTGLDPDDCPLDLHPADVRMLAIAAANTAPCAYVLDEPTVGLDAAGIARLYGFIARLRRAGVGVVVITHDAALTAQADRVVVIRDGRVESEVVPA